MIKVTNILSEILNTYQKEAVIISDKKTNISSIFDEISKLEDKTGGIGTLTEGQKAIDKAFSKEYGEFVLKGGFADVQKGLSQLNEAVDILKTEGGTGSIIGNLPDSLSAFFNKSGLKGYYADVQFVNNSINAAELFAVSSEVSESSK